MSAFGAMSGTLATIFSLEKSKKWIIREGGNGISRSGSGAPIARGLKKSRGLRIRRATVYVRGRMSIDSAPHDRDDFTTDQREREACGAPPYGRYLEEFEVGAVYKHWPAKTVTEADDHLFCLITMNHHPLHINDVYAQQVPAGPQRRGRARSSTRSRSGMSVSDVSGKAIANLATEELKHPAPVFHGDTLFVRVRGAREARVAVQARPRHRQGPHPRPQPGRHARRRVQAPRARPAAGARRPTAEGNVE